ncbi:MAG: biotin--[acetyl-CoA-carboxylase] ligase, partial [Sphingobium sp.]
AKFCGMLLEARGDAIIVGFGMNITHAPQIEGRETTCLADHGMPAQGDAAGMSQLLADYFAQWVDTWRTRGLNVIRDAWLRAAHPQGTALRVNLPDGTQAQGAFAGLAADGALLLARKDGGETIVHAGDVFAL